MRNNNRATVVATQMSEISEIIVLETPKARVIQFGSRKDRARQNRDLSWLAGDVFSTASGYRE